MEYKDSQVPQNPNVPNYPVPSNKTHQTLIFIIAILLLIIVGGGAFVFARYIYSPKPSSDISTQQPVSSSAPSSSNSFSDLNTEKVSTPPPTVDETAGWKTYTNTLFNYEIKYPIDWELSNTGPDSGGGTPASSSFMVGLVKQGYKNRYPMYNLSIEPAQNLLVNNVEKNTEKAFQNWVGAFRGYTLGGMVESKKTLGGVPMVVIEGTTKYEGVGNVPNTLYEKIYAFKTPDNKSAIAILTWVASSNDSTIFDQILSTFKFN